VFPSVWFILADVQAFEDGPDRGFRNVGQYKPDAGKHPKVNTVNTEHSESLKSRIIVVIWIFGYDHCFHSSYPYSAPNLRLRRLM
jgi:hypothetical protein